MDLSRGLGDVYKRQPLTTNPFMSEYCFISFVFTKVRIWYEIGWGIGYHHQIPRIGTKGKRPALNRGG
jgi:hypothetical protein